MKEFMFFIRSEENPMATASPEQLQQHLQKVGSYIQRLTREGKMKSAQPLASEGVRISNAGGSIVDGPYNESKEVISGYYHILADDLDEAIAIAKADPHAHDARWVIEVRPVIKIEGINA